MLSIKLKLSMFIIDHRSSYYINFNVSRRYSVSTGYTERHTLRPWAYAGFLLGRGSLKNITCPFSSNIKYFKYVSTKPSCSGHPYLTDNFNPSHNFCGFQSIYFRKRARSNCKTPEKQKKVLSDKCPADKNPFLIIWFWNSLYFINLFK